MSHFFHEGADALLAVAMIVKRDPVKLAPRILDGIDARRDGMVWQSPATWAITMLEGNVRAKTRRIDQLIAAGSPTIHEPLASDQPSVSVQMFFAHQNFSPGSRVPTEAFQPCNALIASSSAKDSADIHACRIRGGAGPRCDTRCRPRKKSAWRP